MLQRCSGSREGVVGGKNGRSVDGSPRCVGEGGEREVREGGVAGSVLMFHDLRAL